MLILHNQNGRQKDQLWPLLICKCNCNKNFTTKMYLLKVNEQIIFLKLPEFLSYLFLLLNQTGDPAHFHHSGERGGREKIICWKLSKILMHSTLLLWKCKNSTILHREYTGYMEKILKQVHAFITRRWNTFAFDTWKSGFLNYIRTLWQNKGKRNILKHQPWPF